MKPLSQRYSDDKPREKLIRKGPQALKSYELMAILLGSGTQHKDVLHLSREVVQLLDRGHDAVMLNDLTEIYGLGQAKAATVLSALELSRRYLLKPGIRIEGAADVYALLKAYAGKRQEYLLSVTLDGASRVIETRVVGIGTLNQSLVHPREVFADAIADRAAGIIIAHNHPSGVLEPSLADRQVTRRLKEVSELVGIELLDHVILSTEGFLSLREEGVV
jgi:DNA repair protein RadC